MDQTIADTYRVYCGLKYKNSVHKGVKDFYYSLADFNSFNIGSVQSDKYFSLKKTISRVLSADYFLSNEVRDRTRAILEDIINQYNTYRPLISIEEDIDFNDKGPRWL